MDRNLTDFQPGLSTSAIVGALTIKKTGTTARDATFPDASITVARSDAAQTFTGDQTFGTVKAATLDTNVAAAGVTLAGTTLAADGTDANISIAITPKGTGSVVQSKVDINGGAIDGTAIGGATPAAVSATTLAASGQTTLSGQLVLPKTSGYGVKVDTTTPTFPFADMLGFPMFNTGGANAPVISAIRGGNCRALKFVANDRMTWQFHIPHDYAPGTDVKFHLHWFHNGTAISGNLVVGAYYTYAKGWNQAIFPAEKTLNITYATVDVATTPQYRHRIDEITISGAGGSTTLLDSSTFEPDGMISVAIIVSTLPTITSGDLFIPMCDLHYQTTGVGTKSSTGPNFYT